jgi:hypothetical protein
MYNTINAQSNLANSACMPYKHKGIIPCSISAPLPINILSVPNNSAA